MTDAIFGGIVRSSPLPTREQAIGELARATPLERAAFEDDPAFFEPIRKPGSADWLREHDEAGQTVDEYRLALSALKPSPEQEALYMLPLGQFQSGAAPSLAKLREFSAAFFGMDTRLLGAVPLEKVPAKRRFFGAPRKLQLRTADILQWLPSKKTRDAYSIIAVTMEDLYPDETWNFVYGEALLHGGAGVFSFARYDPVFYAEKRNERTNALILLRSCKVLAHETGHMFGLMHCVFFQCLMNGSNHLQEADSQPMHLCPVCLRKLQLSAGFDLLKREEALLKFYEANGLKDEADWSRRRIQKMRAAK
ncbi:archaemetzincin [Prosthecobacter sp.]|uniref:archaemetzincin n=1 Tax=Prosthecobacter sp. TaxID=1965333 RepID=UPI0037832C30